MQQTKCHIEIYLPTPTGAFCILLDNADDILDFDETDRDFWKKGLKVFDEKWKPLPYCVSQTILPKGVELRFELNEGYVHLTNPPGEQLEINWQAKMVQGLLNITIVQ